MFGSFFGTVIFLDKKIITSPHPVHCSNCRNCRANRRRKVQQRRSSTRSNRKHTMAPLAAAIRSMCDLGAQLTASWNRLYAGFCRGGKTGEPGEKPSKQIREPTQTQPTYGVWSGNRTSATLVGGECSHHCGIPAPLKLLEPCSPRALA